MSPEFKNDPFTTIHCNMKIKFQFISDLSLNRSAREGAMEIGLLLPLTPHKGNGIIPRFSCSTGTSCLFRSVNAYEQKSVICEMKLFLFSWLLAICLTEYRFKSIRNKKGKHLVPD